VTPHSYQEASIAHLLKVLPRNQGAVDGSDGGVGKTLVAVEVVKQLDLPTLVVCPKVTIPGWARTGEAQGTEFDIINPEKLRYGSTPYGEWKAPKGKMKERFHFHPGVKCVVFDECHRYQGLKSDNADMMMAARRQGILALALSATLANDPLDLKALGYILRLHDGDDNPTLRNLDPLTFWSWARNNGCGKGKWSALEFKGTAEKRMETMRKISETIFPDRGVRVRISEIPDFPETQITAELYAGDAAKAQALYKAMEKQIASVKDSLRGDFERALEKMPEDLRKFALECVAGDETRMSEFINPLTNVLRIREELELLKVPVFKELADDAVADGRSVVIFVNFQRTVDALSEVFKTSCVIDGSPDGVKFREINRQRFQDDKERVIIVNAEAGGVGLDLHDVRGQFPREAFHSAGFNAKTVRQATLRVRRNGGLSKSLQRFIFLADTYDEYVYRSLSRKLNNLDSLNDRDLIPDNLRLSVDAG
jgi:hypothetical protein